mmetsp:Transcript_28363/g.53643  ORF Transcript_28363/g.53643 Transcript_28363/m.53643 type:complete len:203 (-) Transcript_28363:169-777(-)
MQLGCSTSTSFRRCTASLYLFCPSSAICFVVPGDKALAPCSSSSSPSPRASRPSRRCWATFCPSELSRSSVFLSSSFKRSFLALSNISRYFAVSPDLSIWMRCLSSRTTRARSLLWKETTASLRCLRFLTACVALERMSTRDTSRRLMNSRRWLRMCRRASMTVCLFSRSARLRRAASAIFWSCAALILACRSEATSTQASL